MRVILAVMGAVALAACNPSAPSGESADAPNANSSAFPDLTTAAYRVEATINGQSNTPVPVVMIRSGAKMRMEIADPTSPATLIVDGDTGESFILSSMGGRQMAIRATGADQGVVDPLEQWQGELSQTATRTGDCSVAGLTGAEWTKTTAEDGTDTVCVTSDAILLRATDDGRVVWETTAVERGPQAANLFTLPEGVRVMDLSNMGSMAREAIEAAKQRNN